MDGEAGHGYRGIVAIRRSAPTRYTSLQLCGSRPRRRVGESCVV